MRTTTVAVTAILALMTLGALANAEETTTGTILDTSSHGLSYIESMKTAIERDRLAPPPDPKGRRAGENGVWIVPSRGASGTAHSGTQYVINKWGDTRMGIGFPQLVDVQGAFFMGQAARGVWTPAVRVIAYRDDQVVGETEWFDNISATPVWFEMNLKSVDRIEVLSMPVLKGGGWYGLDDLTYTPASDGETIGPRQIVLDFEDLSYKHKLTGSGYAGLTWETGSGDFTADEDVHGPLAPPGAKSDGDGRDGAEPSGTRAVTPNLIASFQGVIRGDASSMSYPPDTDGAIGPNHFVETVNRNFAVYNRYTGAELTNILLGSFLPGSNGDPRVVFDQHSGRWIVHVCDFSATATIYLAVSLTDDPMGNWFKTSFATDEDEDVGNWPDYPTLGVDANGIYIGAYMIGGGGMSLFAIDKAPLVSVPPSLGTIYAFRQLPWEGALQPAHTYGNPGGDYVVSVDSSSALRLRKVNSNGFPWTLSNLGTVSVSSFSDPPNAPALGSSTALNTVDDRLMMSVYRDGSLWTSHTISASGRAACRWYEIDVTTQTLVQSGTVADPSLHYFFPSIMVNQTGDAVMAFTGSNSSQYAACYYTGRAASDPAGEMAPPVMYKAGTGPQNNIDGYGRNRWGDYSYTTLDPVDQSTIWTVQEYGHDDDIWGTYIAALSVAPPDCNDNGVPDDEDIANGTSEDCNTNGIPDECELPDDCNENGSPDFCDLIDGTSQDCNANGIPDECDIADGASTDCQPNGIPDECEIGSTEGTIAFPLDSDPGWTTEGQWAWGQPTGGGGQYGEPDPTSGHTGPNVYGYNLSGDYTNGMSETHLTSAAIDCSDLEGAHLTFWRWLGVEQPTYDHAYVRVSNNGSNWITLWSNSAEVADSSWQFQEFDIASVADGQSTVYLRWTMGTTDGSWQYCGWNIDDIEITGLQTGGGEGDCNANAVPDACDIAGGASQDCNTNGVPDECDIANGTSEDADGNGIPDECEGFLPGDMDCDGDVDFDDIDPFVLALSGQAGYEAAYPDCHWLSADADGDGDVDFDDIDPFVALLSGD